MKTTRDTNPPGDLRRTTGSRRLSVILAHSPGLASLQAQAMRSKLAAEIIAPVCIEMLPGFDPRVSGNCVLQGDRLRLHLRNAPQAAKIRQMLPSLRKILRLHGLEGIEIELMIQPDPMNYPPGTREAGATYNHNVDNTKTQSPWLWTALQIEPLLDFATKLANTSRSSPLAQAASELKASVKRALANGRN